MCDSFFKKLRTFLLKNYNSCFPNIFSIFTESRKIHLNFYLQRKIKVIIGLLPIFKNLKIKCDKIRDINIA